MRRRRSAAAWSAAAWVAAAGAVGVAGGCGASAAEQARREAQDFQCHDRAASYTATRHMAGDEIGVQIDCAAAGPRIKRWKTDRNGARIEDARSLTPNEFDRVWRELAGTGWENLKDCTTGTLGKQDPVYVFDVRDDQNQATFQCQTKTLPFPYNGIADPLDVAAQRGRGQLGDEEPADLKALDQKAKPEP
ncbi:MAG TPA: hypothetical protein VN253_25670 [Kofleriaceae bacterium]|nr:hypothetical protein [Kofleriaceae bacterium]